MVEEEKKALTKVVVIVGPTAVGKTALSIHLAKKCNGEIINGDSMQVYEGLDIGTAKVTEEEAEGIPHHLLGFVPVTEDYTAADFKRDAREAIDRISASGKLPIIVGGSGLYIEGLLFDMQFGGVAIEDPTYRQQLEDELEKTSAEQIWSQLKEKDPKAAEQIHPNNSRRVIRALEVIHFGDKLFSEQEDREAEAHYDALLIGLNTDRSILYERINRRVDSMLENGLLEEARALYDLDLPEKAQSTRGIGYKEWFDFFKGKVSLEEATENLKQNSRRYAKRQLTWFRNRMKKIHWFDLIQDKDALARVENLVDDFIDNN
ncbi:trna dimethylallyltransferase [Trichococcus palustris]|uniref:tRNA dimethylallyltransferase n=1 Tax=Trichococcus palustris TaxID=140314 RepID=A0A143YFW0_9LACT|nr:tRNA (adenosine(37)-N6)-dimethylallyltransferase MiaA [Trichococcus palustris]CZQ87400.1 trna dimethylallyltransferase [Trichococcus palustris]SFK79021.1 tRNA dimethylallyltransferase [Trichococcus palustris]